MNSQYVSSELCNYNIWQLKDAQKYNANIIFYFIETLKKGEIISKYKPEEIKLPNFPFLDFPFCPVLDYRG